MDRKQGMEIFRNSINKIEEELTNLISLECIKSLGDSVMEYKDFYLLIKNKYIKGYEKIHEGFTGEDFGDLIEILLSDGSSIKAMVKRNTFYDKFLIEDTIAIDTFECLEKLKEMIKNKYYVTELHIQQPICLDNKQQKFINRTINFSGIINGGTESVDFGDIEAVSQSIIEQIP